MTVDAWVARLEAAAQGLPPRAARTLKQELEFLAERVRENVPVRTGTLRDSVRVEIDRAPAPDATQVSGTLVVGGPTAPYAWAVHEDPDGRVSEGTPEGGRGPKYLTRVTDHHRARLTTLGQRVLGDLFAPRAGR
jgi:hypothetical protein